MALNIARQKIPHNIAEKPATIDMYGDKSSKKLQKIPLSNHTLRLRINYMLFDIKNHHVVAIKITGLFSTELNETTDQCQQLEVNMVDSFLREVLNWI